MRVAIIGSGFGLYGLLPAFNSIKGCEVVAICGKKSERLMSYCNSIGLTNIYTDWKELLEQEKLDAVAIAVVPSAQYEIAKVAISKGLHVFAEKPLTANNEQARELLALAKKKKITTAVDFIFQEIDEWQKAKELLDSKKYGELKHVSVAWDFLSYDIKNKISSWKTDVKAGGGVLSFFSSHVLHYLEHFGGEIQHTKSIFSYDKASKNGGEVGVDMLMKFKSGATGQMHVFANNHALYKHQVIFTCDKAVIVLESTEGVTEHFTLTIHTNGKVKSITVKKANNKKTDEDERVRTVRKLAIRFINGCRSHSHVSPSFVDGVRVEKLIEDIRKTSF